MNVTQYIKESCEHQNATTPEDFIGMARAYEYTYQLMLDGAEFTTQDIWWLAAFINNNDSIDFRCQPATFANGDRTTVNDRDTILRQVKLLTDNRTSITPDEFYQRFEEIHGFPDGNGRCGSLLWNLLNGTLAYPIHPPVFKSVM